MTATTQPTHPAAILAEYLDTLISWRRDWPTMTLRAKNQNLAEFYWLRTIEDEFRRLFAAV